MPTRQEVQTHGAIAAGAKAIIRGLKVAEWKALDEYMLAHPSTPAVLVAARRKLESELWPEAKTP